MLDLKRIIIVVSIIIIIGIIIGFFIYMNNTKKDEIIEYTPQEEISEQQLRQTIVSLYFKNNDELIPEARLIDVKELINNPYEKIIELLLEGPKNENLKKLIPEGTKINKIEKEGENLILDFSQEFIKKTIDDEKEEKLIIQSLVKTLTELTEINGIKIKINGEENKKFENGKIIFNQVFNRDFN